MMSIDVYALVFETILVYGNAIYTIALHDNAIALYQKYDFTYICILLVCPKACKIHHVNYVIPI